MSDFNEVLEHNELRSFDVGRSQSINGFRHVVSNCGLFDLRYKGQRFTYTNRAKDFAEFRARFVLRQIT